MTVLDTINASGFSTYLYGVGAIDFWLTGKITNKYLHILTDADITDLAKLFDNLRYPGINLADAALDEADKTFYFRCLDSENDKLSQSQMLSKGQHLSKEQQQSQRQQLSFGQHSAFALLDFYRDCKTNTFIDPHGIYPILIKIRKQIINLQGIITAQDEKNCLSEIFSEGYKLSIDDNHILTDAALILSKYFTHDCVTDKDIKKIAAQLKNFNNDSGQEEQRVFLSELITSPNPGLGFELLKAGGFIKKHWPELAILEQADHSKEFHPEGNAWEHTMETFRHRKQGFLNAVGSFDIRLSLGLLLHDIGKPIAKSTGNHRYESHAELGEIQARRFLERLGFNASITRDICFLVRNHMLPAALPRLPLFRTEQIMSSDLFPLLMELYRCDESSSFKGLDGYYESSAAYQQFLKNRRNPYRTTDGKKLNK